MTTPDRLLRLCLGGLVLSLLLIGVVSATPLRHLVQAIPVIVALGLVCRSIGWSPYAALPLFLFWLLLISLIWLFIFGLAHFITGTFFLPERILTIAIILSSIFGIRAVFRASPFSGWKSRSLAFLIFALLSVAAL